MGRCATFFLTLVCYCLYQGILGVFSVIKDPLTSEFHFTESFLGTSPPKAGIVDGMLDVGRFLATIYMLLFTYTSPTSEIFYNSCGFAVFQGLMILATWIPNYSKALFIISNIGGGYCRNFVIIVYMLVSGTFSNPEDRNIVHIWFTLTSLGNIISVPFTHWMIYSLNVHWSIPFGIFLAAIFLSALGIKLFVEDIQIEA